PSTSRHSLRYLHSFPTRRSSDLIGAAGMYIEVLLAALGIFAWWYSHPGLLHHLCLNLFFVSTVTTVIFNANPLMRYDGYCMMSEDRKSTRLNSSHQIISYAVFCL